MVTEESPLQPTRWEIMQILKKRRRATVDELAKALSMTLMAIRLHLVVLERDGLVSRSSVRERPGRPTLVYALTEHAEDLFPKSYDTLTCMLLEKFTDRLGQEEVEATYRSAGADLARPYLVRTQGRTMEERVVEATRALNERHCFAEWERQDCVFLMHLYNCPFYRVAMQHHHLCNLDYQFLTLLLDTQPERLSSLLNNQGRCTFSVPAGKGNGHHDQ